MYKGRKSIGHIGHGAEPSTPDPLPREPEICPECGQERFEIELADCVWWGCGCGDHLTAMVGPGQLTACEGCGRDLPVLTDEELAALPDLAPALCEGCLQGERVELRRMARGGDR